MAHRQQGVSLHPRSMTSASSELHRLLRCRYPVLLAPMAGIGGGRLARAVSDAGGFGFVGGGYGDEPWLHEELQRLDGVPFGVGFITWALKERPHLLAQVVDAGAAAILLSFGDIRPFAGAVNAAGRILVAQVQTLSQAREAEAEGAHIIVAQGGEGGGHSGVRGTLALVPAVVDAVKVPVVAAGGIADGRGLAAALALGAQGVLCGTAFYAAEESLAHPHAKQLLTQASGDTTTKGELFDVARGLNWPSGPWGLRTLQNTLTQQWQGASSALLRAHAEELQATIAQARQTADHRLAPVIAGEAADLVRKVEPAALIVKQMVETARRSIERLAPVHRAAPDR